MDRKAICEISHSVNQEQNALFRLNGKMVGQITGNSAMTPAVSQAAKFAMAAKDAGPQAANPNGVERG